MRNIFILYMPPGNLEAMVHYEDTIGKKVSPERIYDRVDVQTRQKLEAVFGRNSIAVWGSRDSKANRSKFDRMDEGDEVLIVEGSIIRLLGRVAAKTVNPILSRDLWKNIRGGSTGSWDLIYFIANPREINLPFSHFCKLVGWQEDFQLHGFTTVSTERLENFYSRYDDLYEILLGLKQGRAVEAISQPSMREAAAPDDFGDVPGPQPSEENPSEHLRMQWMLLRMGVQAGEKVWAPRNDQARISAKYEFSGFEPTFAAGLDAQVKYVENIDVVWKEQFRIDAAFEVENSTSIYSGLLRFADLTMVAPNTVYPMFIVAPAERRNRVREQLTRPTFRHLKLGEKVRYLPYETVNEIDHFFGETGRGVSVEVFVGKSEKLSS
jgi:hypothetical protein